jgi:hypothetical protein
METAYSYFFKKHFNIVFAVFTDTVARNCASNLQYDIEDPTRDYFVLCQCDNICHSSYDPEKLLYTILFRNFYYNTLIFRNKWVPVTTECCVLKFRMQKHPPIWRVAAKILNKHLRTADKVWSSSLGGWARC